MHGSVMAALRSYITAQRGADGWHSIVVAAGATPRPYVPTQEYPDQEAVALVQAAAAAEQVSAAVVLERFGEFLGPQLLKMYQAFVLPQWTVLDLFEHIEDTIHRVVRIRNPGASPPSLQSFRPAPDVVEVVYMSERRMCSLAIGLLRSIGHVYGETLEIEELRCMLKGDSCCTIRVRRLAQQGISTNAVGR